MDNDSPRRPWRAPTLTRILAGEQTLGTGGGTTANAEDSPSGTKLPLSTEGLEPGAGYVGPGVGPS